jgi:enolase
LSATSIAGIRARQILDSRGRPTLEAEVQLRGGSLGRASVPSGASTGAAEARELRDGDPAQYEGRGVRKAADNVMGEIRALLAGRDALDQRGIDSAMRALDGTPRLARLGGNAVLAVSLATLRAGADATGEPLHRRIATLMGTAQPTLPMPMVNILSGGLHAGRGMDVQDFLVIPVGAASYTQALDWVSRVRSAAAELLAARGITTLLADEGGLSPGFERSRTALDLMVAALERARLRPSEDAAIALDIASSSLVDAQRRYAFARLGRTYSSEEMIEELRGWLRDYPIVSIEDGLHEEDWASWPRLTRELGEIQLVGDDLFCTQPARIARGIAAGAANCVLVKVNQNGDFSGACDAIAEARRGGYATVISARSGETEDAFIADFAVGSAGGQIKVGSVRSSERLAKYNQLLRIEEDGLPFAGRAALAGAKPSARGA